MSDSESIQFMEFSDMESTNSLHFSKGVPPACEKNVPLPNLNKPPLPVGSRNISSKRHSVQTELEFLEGGCGKALNVAGGACGVDSDGSESIHFQIEGAGQSTSLHSRVFAQRALPSSRERSTSDGGEESIRFTVDDSEGTAGKRGSAAQDSVRDSSIIFNVLEETCDDGTDGARNTTELRNKSLGEAGRRHSDVRPEGADSFSGRPSSLRSGAEVKPGTVGALTLNQLSKPAPTEEPSRRSPSTRTGTTSSIGGELDKTRTPKSVPPRKTRKANRSCSAGRAAATRLISSAESAGAHDMLQRPREGSVKTETPSAAAFASLSQPADLDLGLSQSEIQELFLQAQLYTEHWKLYNDLQRDEIVGLIRRIKEARGVTSFSENIEAFKGAKKAAASKVSFVDVTNGKREEKESSRARHKSDLNSGSNTGHLSACPQSTAGGVSAAACAPSHNASRKHPEPREISHSSEKLTQVHASPMGTTTTPGFSATDVGGEWKSRFEKEVRRDSVRKLADSLGIVWPPPLRDEIYFRTGKRLTPQQREEFYKALALQAKESSKLVNEFHSVCDLDGELAVSCGTRKQRVTRTTVLRKGFELMDINKEGVIQAAELPVLRKLLEAEQEQLKRRASGAPRADTILSLAETENTKLNGTVSVSGCAKRTPVRRKAGFNNELALYSLVLEVFFPLLASSGLLAFDFTTMGLLVFGPANTVPTTAYPNFSKWRTAAQHHFQQYAKCS
ncbi:hypothetical protein TRVL_09106 [Trypanosoma vivax]|uniref:EF-hand domain-containing protein n=1 Tax=Trypanosoma vivax (strain Y486) TaxID=1055687 RepID=G0TZX1_TRYVY|nr:hypothetical protein TRVL_09106 [Trypanosoma vivax]CCC50149.1 conserved hypothetical protein [Trypanosoma vivax Y486]